MPWPWRAEPGPPRPWGRSPWDTWGVGCSRSGRGHVMAPPAAVQGPSPPEASLPRSCAPGGLPWAEHHGCHGLPRGFWRVSGETKRHRILSKCPRSPSWEGASLVRVLTAAHCLGKWPQECRVGLCLCRGVSGSSRAWPGTACCRPPAPPLLRAAGSSLLPTSALLPGVPEPTQPCQCQGLLWARSGATRHAVAVWGQGFAHRCVGPGSPGARVCPHGSFGAGAQGWPGPSATTHVTLGGETGAWPLILQAGFPGGLLPSFPTVTHLGQLRLSPGSRRGKGKEGLSDGGRGAARPREDSAGGLRRAGTGTTTSGVRTPICTQAHVHSCPHTHLPTHAVGTRVLTWCGLWTPGAGRGSWRAQIHLAELSPVGPLVLWPVS